MKLNCYSECLKGDHAQSFLQISLLHVTRQLQMEDEKESRNVCALAESNGVSASIIASMSSAAGTSPKVARIRIIVGIRNAPYKQALM